MSSERFGMSRLISSGFPNGSGLARNRSARGARIASVAILGVVLSRWIVPSLGGLRFGMIAAAFGLLAGWLW